MIRWETLQTSVLSDCEIACAAWMVVLSAAAGHRTGQDRVAVIGGPVLEIILTGRSGVMVRCTRRDMCDGLIDGGERLEAVGGFARMCWWGNLG